jgi:dTMP kinase
LSFYLVLEGGDGVGKSHQAQLLKDWLEDQGQRVRHLREPGSTTTGEAIRRLLLAPGTGGLSPWTEALLFSAARYELLQHHVRPALARGELVLAERCWLSTMAYQCMAPLDPAQRVPLDELETITRSLHGDTWPHRVFLLDVDAATRQARAGSDKDRIEAREEAFHEAVRQAYLELGASDARVLVVDANGPVDEVQSRLRAATTSLLQEVRP